MSTFGHNVEGHGENIDKSYLPIGINRRIVSLKRSANRLIWFLRIWCLAFAAWEIYVLSGATETFSICLHAFGLIVQLYFGIKFWFFVKPYKKDEL